MPRVDGGVMAVISVALPVWRDEGGGLERAAGCVLGQTLGDLELLIVCNGSDEGTLATAARIETSDRRVRVVRVLEAGLANALNVAFREASAEVVARMDADDWCPRERLAVQWGFLKERGGLAGVGCGYEVVRRKSATVRQSDRATVGEPWHGGRLFVVRPPVDPREARWRLLLGNCFAHGSMMLRREAVVEAGGYDRACARAQDYDLWLRLSRRGGLCSVPEVLYTHVARDGEDATRSTREQALVAVAGILRAWGELPSVRDREGLARAMVEAMSHGGDAGAARAKVEELLRDEVSGEALMAWLWSRYVEPPAPARAVEVGRRARMREVCAGLRAEGVEKIWLWGAGEHTRSVLGVRESLGVEVVGVVDDVAVGECGGLAVARPAMLKRGDVVVLSSDWHEDAMWGASVACRERGVRVVRVYGGE